MTNKTIHTWLAFIIYAALMTAGFVWTTYLREAPYEIFAKMFTYGFGFYAGKRLAQKGKWFANGTSKPGDNGLPLDFDRSEK
uniref:Uncharacterized protein n=1 Tax=viral metagenome TaxID=1070528 RepID=A0A6M3IJ53_9ZZZZ